MYKKRYRLYLDWDSIQYVSDDLANLKGARFYGPVLKDAAEIASNDHINLDITSQYVVVLGHYYMVELSWGEVKYSADGEIHLSDARLRSEDLVKVHKLRDGDRILINTEMHEEETHAYHLVYESSVERTEGDAYDFKQE